MRLRQIEVFYTVYASGSISKAAEILGVSQPAVSNVLKHTEDTLGYLLFERRPSGLVPTSEANEIFKDAASIFHEVSQFRYKLRSVPLAHDRPIRIAMAPSIALAAGAEIIAAFLAQNSGTGVEVETFHFNEAVLALRANKIDLAIVYQPFKEPGIRSVPLASARCVCIAPKGQEKAGSVIGSEQLKNRTLIRLGVEAPLGHIISTHIENLDAKDQKDQKLLVAHTYYIAKMLVERGAGIAIVDIFTACFPPSDKIDVLELENEIRVSICAITLESHALTKRETQFLDLIRQEMARMIDATV